MVPDKFNMVDMGGIDLIMMQGEEVPGLYNRLVESIAQCRYQCLYNWYFDGIAIPPTYVIMEVNEDDEVVINEGVTVTDDDVVHIYSIEPSPPEPEIIPLLAEENGVYNVPSGKDGFNPVTVDVPSYTPVINPITITENGTYTTPSGVDGYSPLTINVSGGVGQKLQLHYGRLDIKTGEIVESAEYCYSDLVPISSGTGYWFLDLDRQDVGGYYIGLRFLAQDGATMVDYMRQYETYRKYYETLPDAKYFRLCAKVSSLSYAKLVFTTDNILIGGVDSIIYKLGF